MADETPKAAPPRSGEHEEALEQIREQAVPILVTVVIALLVVGGIQFHRYQKQSASRRASAMLLQAQSLDQLQTISAEYQSTPSAPLAELSIASQNFSEGRYSQAEATYRKFMELYPDHPGREMAQYGLAMCQEAGGLINQAMSAFEAFVKEHGEHYLTPLAKMGRARCLAQMNRLEEARVAYEDLIAEDPEGSWAGVAENGKAAVEQQLRAQQL